MVQSSGTRSVLLYFVTELGNKVRYLSFHDFRGCPSKNILAIDKF